MIQLWRQYYVLENSGPYNRISSNLPAFGYDHHPDMDPPNERCWIWLVFGIQNFVLSSVKGLGYIQETYTVEIFGLRLLAACSISCSTCCSVGRLVLNSNLFKSIFSRLLSVSQFSVWKLFWQPCSWLAGGWHIFRLYQILALSWFLPACI